MQRAVSSLQALQEKRLDRQFEAIVSKVSDGQTLATVVLKFWAKKSPSEQVGLEPDLLQWLRAVEEKYDVTVSKMGPLERIDAAMESYVERKSMEEGVDWSTFATLAAMELPFKDDEESSEVINLLLSMGDSAAEKGTAEQEGELRAILVRAMARCSTKSRKAELAQACEAVVCEEVESRRIG